MIRCAVFYEPQGLTRQERREGGRSELSPFMQNEGWAYPSIRAAKDALQELVAQLKACGWQVQGNKRRGYFTLTRGAKTRVAQISPE